MMADSETAAAGHSDRHHVTAVNRGRAATRHVRRCLPRVAVRAQHFLPNLRIRHSQLPRMYTDDTGNPARRTVHTGRLHHRFGEISRMCLEPVVFLPGEHADDPGVLEALGHVIGQPH